MRQRAVGLGGCFAFTMILATVTLSNQVGAAENELQLTLPPMVNAVPDVRCNVFFDNIVLTQSANDYDFDVTCDIGESHDDHWFVVPAAGDVGEHQLTISVRADGKEISRASTVLNVVPQAAGADVDGPIKLLIIGDSLTHASAYPNEVARLLNQPGNPRWRMLGSHRPTAVSDGVAHEGYGGWTWERFATMYEPDPDGTHRKRSSPFVFLGDNEKPALDFPRYFGAHCDGDPPDYIVIMLGINDCFGAPPDDRASIDARIDKMFGYADQLLTSMQTAAPLAHIGLCLTTPPNARQEAFEANYKDRYTRWGWKRIQHRLVQREMEYVRAKADSRLSAIPTQLNLDPVDGYPINNGVHPNTDGYRQIGASVYAWMKSELANSRTTD